MSSKTLFVWLAAAIVCVSTAFLPSNNAFAQLSYGAPEILCIDTGGDPGVDLDTDEILLTVTATYSMNDFVCSDSTRVGLDPDPGLGVLTPSLVATETFGCPTEPVNGLYVMSSTVTPNTNLQGNFQPGVCLVTAQLQFHPECVSALTNTWLPFNITWRVYNNTSGYACVQRRDSVRANCDIETDCCIYLGYSEHGGFRYDGIIAIGDSVWIDSANVAFFDSLPGDGTTADTVYADLSALTGAIADTAVPLGDTIAVASWLRENLIPACTDTIKLYRKEWDRATETWDDPAVGTVTDTLYCVRQVDNLPPELEAAWIDSCSIINNNYFDNDTLVGCGDVLRIWMTTLETPAAPFQGDARGTATDVYYSADGSPACDNVYTNFDVGYLIADLSVLQAYGLIGGDGRFPFNTAFDDPADTIGLISTTPDSVLISMNFYDPGDATANNYLYLDIPIDTTNWDSIEWCLLQGILDGESLDVYCADDAGNLSPVVRPAGDSTGTLQGWDVCIDTWAPELPGNDIVYTGDFCGKRFSPYDSALATLYTNLSPDSIVWYLDLVGDETWANPLSDVYMIGFDVRAIPDDEPDTPTGSIVTVLDFYHPVAEPDSDNWAYLGVSTPELDASAAVFTWYGKDGPDSLDPDLGILHEYCEWGMLAGITEARYMDAAGCNAVLGSDHDGQTSISEGYTQLNNLYCVVDSCFPDVVANPGDMLHLDTLVLGSPMPHGIAFPDSGLAAEDTWLWLNGEPNPVLEFRAERFYNTGLFDTCLAEQLYYRIRVDSVYIQEAAYNPGASAIGDSGEVYYTASDNIDGSATPIADYIPFDFNDIHADTIRFEWGHEFPNGDPLNDGLYRVSLEIIDDAGNVYQDPLWVWINGIGPAIDSIMVVNTLFNCHTNFFIGEELGIWVQTDTTCSEVLIDWSCILGVDPALDTLIVTTPYDQNLGANQLFWYGSILVTDAMVDAVDDTRNYYEIAPYDPSCQLPSNEWRIPVTAFDSDGNFTEADPTHSCDIAILGLSRCPRIVGLPELYYYDPDTIEVGSATVLAEYDTFDVMPWWNAMSPGSIDSLGAYNSLTNPAHDEQQDSIFVRILIDTLSITHPTIGADTTFHDTLVVQFYNPTLNRTREIRKPLFIPVAADMSPFDWPYNEIYDGRLERDETNAAMAEFRLQWNGSWYLGAGDDSLMLVPPMDQDTIIIRAYTIDGDSFTVDINSDTTYLICDTVAIDLDVDNNNPDFVDHTLIAPGQRDPETHTTSTIENLGYNGDCGYRYADGDTFQIKVVIDEQVHYDPAAYPNDAGSHKTAGGEWGVIPHWNVSLIDTLNGDLIAVGGDTITVWLDMVDPVDLGNGNWEYTLTGHFENIPPDTFIYNTALLVRGAWDQGGNPGRWNNPVMTDAFFEDSFEDYTFRVELIDCYIWAGCPDVYGPDMIMGWIAPEDTNITVWATIIETCETTFCPGGLRADSALRVQGDFQTITDDPDPWVLPDEVGPWFLYVDPVTDDTIGWARQYHWTLRADSSDLATIYCDGDYLPFSIRFESVMGVDTTALFDNCVQVDVNEPIWTTATVHDTDFVFIDDVPNLAVCIAPEDPFWLRANFTEKNIDCNPAQGVGVDLTQIWADLSVITQNAANDSIAPDSIEYDTLNSTGVAWWLITADPTFYCLNLEEPILRLHALHDSIGHHDRELYKQDTLQFCSDCLPPFLGSVAAFCDCEVDTAFHIATEAALSCIDIPLGYLRPNEQWFVTACLYDLNGDSSLGLEYVASNYQMDASPFDPALGWITPSGLDTFPPTMTGDNYMAVCSYGIDCVIGPAYNLLETYNNGDTIFTRFRFEDTAGNFDTTDYVAVAIVDTMPALVDFVYTIGDDSIRAYVTPGDDHVHIYADITGGAFDLLAPPVEVWADLSNFWCGGDTADAYDTVYAHEVVQMGPNWYRAYWGWTPSGVYQVYGDTLSQLTDTLQTSPELGSCIQLGAEGWFDTLYFHIVDASCQTNDHYNLFEVSGVDSTTPAIDSVWVWGNMCGEPGWISSTPMDSGHIQVWAWMDTVFNDLSDTLRIDSMQIDLADLSASRWGWTDWTPNLEGGWALDGDSSSVLLDSAYWTILNDGVRDRLVAKWVFLTADDLTCGDEVTVAVKSVRQTGLGGSHGYYIDVEYGSAMVDDTPPWIYDMRVYSATVSDAETTWVSPNYNLIIDVYAADTTCSLLDISHIGFDLTHDEPFGGPGPYLSFDDDGSGCDTLIPYLWTIDPTAFSVEWTSGTNDSIHIRFVGTPNFPDSCNDIDFDNLVGCVTAHIEDCLSNPADPVTKEVITDDRRPEFLSAVPWGDYTYYTGFPGNPDLIGVDSVLVLAQGVYALDWDSVLVVNVTVDNAPGDSLMSWMSTYIDFTGFMLSPNEVQYADEIWYNVDGNKRDSLVWYVDLYDDMGGGELWDTTILSDRYWFPLFLSDSLQNRHTLYCDQDLDSAVTFTIQNWLQASTRGMTLICDSLMFGDTGDSTIFDVMNMDLWNNEKTSPDADMENLYKVYSSMPVARDQGPVEWEWAWYSHEDDNMTRFFVFVEDTVLQNDGIDNDADGIVDEIGEGVDFYTADLRINDYPQVGHVDSMNIEDTWINYLWFADNFSDQRYDVELFISDIYGHRDTLACGEYALTFFEDEHCPHGSVLTVMDDGAPVGIRVNNDFYTSFDLTNLDGNDSIFVFADFDSLELMLFDPYIFDDPQPGSGVDVDTTTDVDSTNWNNGLASTIELLDPTMTPVAFVQTFYHDTLTGMYAPLTFDDPTDAIIAGLADGVYTLRVTALDRMGNSCVYEWAFVLDRSCPEITNAWVTRPGSLDPETHLYTSWDYVEIRAEVEDEFDGIDSVAFDYGFDANRDGEVDEVTLWQTVNILNANGGANVDSEYPWIAYWNIRNLPWSSEDTLGLPPVNPEECVNTYFVRVHSWDIYGHECIDTFAVDIEDDIAPLAYIYGLGHIDGDNQIDTTWAPPQSALIPCYNPNVNPEDSVLAVIAIDSVGGGYDPVPGDTFTIAGRWFDLEKVIFQYKFFEAPNAGGSGNTDPAAGWVNMWTPLEDTVTFRDAWNENFIGRWNIMGLPSHQYNIRAVGIDVCNNVDELNTPVATVRIECDTTAPLALICFPEPDMCVTNYRCDEEVDFEHVIVKSSAPTFYDVDSVAFYFVDSLSVPGMGIHTFLGGTTTPDSMVDGTTFYHSTLWNTDNLLTGYYWLYVVAWDDADLFDPDPMWTRVFVDNTPPEVTNCWIGDAGDDPYLTIQTIGEGDAFYLRALAEDNIGMDMSCGITAVQFQYLDRFGNWRDLPDGANVNGFYGADVYTTPDYGYDMMPDAAGYYECSVRVEEFGSSPLDSIRFRAYAIDAVEYGSPNIQGDRNRDCNVDRDLICGTDICCNAIEIRDAAPDGTDMQCFNNTEFVCCVPSGTPIVSGDCYSTCNSQNPLENLLHMAIIDEEVDDEWFIHFKFWRSTPGYETDTLYIPNDMTSDYGIPALGPIMVESTWDTVFVGWTGMRAYIDSANAADGLYMSQWCFSATVEDLTGNVEDIDGDNTCCINLVCVPQAPITHASYVTNDVENPENRIRVFEEIPYTDFETDTIEVIYNRVIDPGSDDPEALVLFYTDEEAIVNCHDIPMDEANVQLWLMNGDTMMQQVCFGDPEVVFDYFNLDDGDLGWDQYPPDADMDGRYVVGFYLDNTFEPGVYNFAMIAFHDNDDIFNLGLSEGNWDLSNCDYRIGEEDIGRVDLCVRIVNVNEPQVVYCTPEYGDACGAHNTVPLTANDVSDPDYFTGEIDTVWFQYYDGDSWEAIVDPVTGVSYDANPASATIRFEFDEKELPGMAGWYYDRHDNPQLSWYAERDLFPKVWVYITGAGMGMVPGLPTNGIVEMTDDGTGFWTADVALPTYDEEICYWYTFIIDADDNGMPGGYAEQDRWVIDPRDMCGDYVTYNQGEGPTIEFSELCLCEYAINFASRNWNDGHWDFRTVVGWHDPIAYHVIENPAPGDSLHVFFVDNDAPVATHDIEFDIFWLNGGRCDESDEANFVTDIQPVDGSYNLVVEDICRVIYQVSMTNDPMNDSSWYNTDMIYSNNDMGWTEAWPSNWYAYNPLADNIDNDGDGLVDETYDVQAGDGVGEENTTFWSRSVVQDYCGNTYYTNYEEITVDVSEPRACITQVGDIIPGPDGSDVVVIPGDRDIEIVAMNQDYAGFDPAVLGVFQYRTLNPMGAWTNIQADSATSNDTVRHVGDSFTAVWDLLDYFTITGMDPEGWFQLRVIAIDTVNNTDMCDNDVCYITIRLNDIEPASRVEFYGIWNDDEVAAEECQIEGEWYIQPADPYCLRAIFAPTNIDTGLASLTFQYADYDGETTGEWRNIETIWDHIDNGLNGDTTNCVYFQPRPDAIGEHGFQLRVIVEDYNGNDTTEVQTLWVDETAPTGLGVAAEALAFDHVCEEPRCRLDNDNSMVTVTFDPDPQSGNLDVHPESVTLNWERDDGSNDGADYDMEWAGGNTWTFDFEGDLCAFWLDEEFDMGCYYFWVTYEDCAGNMGRIDVTSNCGEDDVDLICIDCIPELPENTNFTWMEYEGWDCVDTAVVSIYDEIFDGNTEVGGDQTIHIEGELPDYQQYIAEVRLFVESADAGVDSTEVSTFSWGNTANSANGHYGFNWWLADTTLTGELKYPSGYYRVWALAVDAICQIQEIEVDEFYLHVDHAEPVAEITEANGQPVFDGAIVEYYSGDNEDAYLWVEWADGLTPDDSTQTHNQVQIWLKYLDAPNQADAWRQVGVTPSPCNPHYVDMSDLTDEGCADSLVVVAIATDRWFNGDLDVERAMEAFDAGHYFSFYIYDTTPSASELWSVGTDWTPCDGDLWIMDQQSHSVSVGAFEGHDVYLHAFSMNSDVSIARMYFEYSLDGGETWFEIGVDEDADYPCDCEGIFENDPWWCGDIINEQIAWSVLWDVSGLSGAVLVRSRSEDYCANFEEWDIWTVNFDVEAPMALVYVWENGVHVDDFSDCDSWLNEETLPQIGDDLELYTWLTVGACADEEEADAYGVWWLIKRADDHPLESTAWCYIADDSTGPFSADEIDFWGELGCPYPEVGTYYDIIALTSDQSGNILTLTQFLNHGAGITYIEKWDDLIANGYVKRFRITDTTAPVATDLVITDDCTPDSSAIFVHGDVMLSAYVEMPDVVALTWAFIEVGDEDGPWTVIERVERPEDPERIRSWGPVEGYWNTELLNGTYILGAFAEDYYGNMDGDLTVGPEGASTNTLVINVDNEPATALINGLFKVGDNEELIPVGVLERGAEHVFDIEAFDNFGYPEGVDLYYRHSGSEGSWTLINSQAFWPYTIHWTVPPELVTGWSYDFIAVASDWCGQNDMYDAQGDEIIDGTWAVVDEEANIVIFSICGENSEVTPHINGEGVILTAHSDPGLDYVRFQWVRDDIVTVIGTVAGNLTQTTWTLTGWDVTTIEEGPAQLCVVGVSDINGHEETVAEECRNIVIDHSLPYELVENGPLSHGFVGGSCSDGDYYGNDSETTDDVWILLNEELTDMGLDSVWFEWKWADDPNDDMYWHMLGVATQDNGLTGNWRRAVDFDDFFEGSCNTISLRAVLKDEAVCEPNMAYILFADSVRLDNCDPVVEITNVNGDFTPDMTEVRFGENIQVVATAEDNFGNGGNTAIEAVCFYIREYDPNRLEEDWTFVTCDTEGPLWSFLLESSAFSTPGEYDILARAWDEAGNCSEDAITINVTDGYFTQACIVGYDLDCGPGCDDKMWAVTDDCNENVTNSVMFEVSEDNGQTWSALGPEVTNSTEYCDENLQYSVWTVWVEFDEIAEDAWFRAVSRDTEGNVDPNPAIFRRTDVIESDLAVINYTDWVQIPLEREDMDMPWVFSMLENFTENAGSPGALVCVEPGVLEDGTNVAAGPLHPSTAPCVLDNEDGRVTIFSSYKEATVVEDDTTWFVHMTTYKMDIHRIDPSGGANGWIASEDGLIEAYLPSLATESGATGWFQPVNDDDQINLLPVNQYYYQWLSEIEAINTKGLTGEDFSGAGPIRAKMRFDVDLLPEDAEDWQVVVATYDWNRGQWVEGTYYNERDLVNGIIDFQTYLDYNFSGPEQEESCPDMILVAVFLTNIRPITEYAILDNGPDCTYPADMTYYTEERGPTVDCDPAFSVILGEGEYPPFADRVDVRLWGPGIPPDGMLIVDDGEPMNLFVASDPDTFHCDTVTTFTVNWDNVSGLFYVAFNPEAVNCPPFYGCFDPGQYFVQFWVDNIPNLQTPFFVDVTGPEAYMEPHWINETVYLWADLTDPEAGIDTTSILCQLINCDYYADEYYDVTSEAMHFEPIENGYRASFTVQWDAIAPLFYYLGDYEYGWDYTDCLTSLCVDWHFENKVCVTNYDTDDYIYTIDQFDPQVWPVSPVGDAIDNDGDGLTNEDWADCINQDNDLWWHDGYGWVGRYDEDKVDFEPMTFNCGQQRVISAVIKNFNGCCSGSSPLNVDSITISIDNIDGGWTFEELMADEDLNFSYDYDGDDVFFSLGGPGVEGPIAEAIYAPGEHIIIVRAMDEVGNFGTNESWTYYVECPGPAVDFAEDEVSGLWFNPEGNPQFSFTVTAPANAPIQQNGIKYSVYTMPDHTLWSGPTSVNPADPTEHTVTYSMSGSWPAGQTGLSIEVETINVFGDLDEPTADGYNFSAQTYWADNYSPDMTNHLPEEGALEENDQNLIVEVYYTDDSEETPGGESPSDSLTSTKRSGKTMNVRATGNGLDDVEISNPKLVSRTVTPSAKGSAKSTKATASSRAVMSSLDDGANGSGIATETVRMTIVQPFSPDHIIIPSEGHEFLELDNQHAKYVLTPPLQAGEWCVNVHFEDLVGNVTNETWCFNVESSGPAISYNAVTGECQNNDYWNPDKPLALNATICELGNVNVGYGNIHVDVISIFPCSTGICEEVLLTNAEFHWSEMPNQEDRAQCFTITAEYTLDFDDALPSDIRIVITATDALGAETEMAKEWTVDGSAPVIEIVSPLPDAVLSSNMVTIQAMFIDDDGTAIASAPAGNDIPRGGDRVLDSIDKSSTKSGKASVGFDKSSKYSSRLDLGQWRQAVTSSLDDLDGNSGVDPQCIELSILKNGGDDIINLTGESQIQGNQITWTGSLDDGVYTAALAVCDEVCNVSYVSWNFVVGGDGEWVRFEEPYYVSAMPHTFTMTLQSEDIDVNSLELMVEGATMYVPEEGDPYEMWFIAAEHAAIVVEEDVITYTANFSLADYHALRLTLMGEYETGIPAGAVSQNYTVDTGMPEIVSVSPDPWTEETPNLLAQNATNTNFEVNFIEVGNTGLDAESVVMRLTKREGGEAVASEPTVELSNNSRSGRAYFTVAAFDPGFYELYFEVEDMAGNRVTKTWTYRVGSGDPSIVEGGETYNYPNPFTPEDEYTTFVLPLQEGFTGAATVKIAIYDLSGRFVANVWDGAYYEGTPLTWRGTNESGGEIANGVYLAHISVQAGGKTAENVVKVAYKKESK